LLYPININNRKLKLVFGGIVVLIFFELVYLFVSSKTTLVIPRFFYKKELLVGKDFIGLDSSKIIKLLQEKENEGKFVFPSIPDENTNLTINPIGDGDLIIISNLLEDDINGRILYNPTNQGFSHHTVGGITYFNFTNGIMVETITPRQLILSSPNDSSQSNFGDIIATGFPDFSDSSIINKFGKFYLSMWKKDPKIQGNYLRISELRLLYKNRWVFLFEEKNNDK